MLLLLVTLVRNDSACTLACSRTNFSMFTYSASLRASVLACSRHLVHGLGSQKLCSGRDKCGTFAPPCGHRRSQNTCVFACSIEVRLLCATSVVCRVVAATVQHQNKNWHKNRFLDTTSKNRYGCFFMAWLCIFLPTTPSYLASENNRAHHPIIDSPLVEIRASSIRKHETCVTLAADECLISDIRAQILLSNYHQSRGGRLFSEQARWIGPSVGPRVQKVIAKLAAETSAFVEHGFQMMSFAGGTNRCGRDDAIEGAVRGRLA